MNFLGQRKPGYLCISLLLAELGDGCRKNAFLGRLEKCSLLVPDCFANKCRFCKEFAKRSEKDKENYRFHLFLVNFLFRFFFDLKQLLILEASFLLI